MRSDLESQRELGKRKSGMSEGEREIDGLIPSHKGGRSELRLEKQG